MATLFICLLLHRTRSVFGEIKPKFVVLRSKSTWKEILITLLIEFILVQFYFWFATEIQKLQNCLNSGSEFELWFSPSLQSLRKKWIIKRFRPRFRKTRDEHRTAYCYRKQHHNSERECYVILWNIAGCCEVMRRLLKNVVKDHTKQWYDAT